ncbi:hypothetical protein BCR41DRAFT_365073 [Lobosporangium transversale]|uniref:F-box domain-containing protein n=1 Tax=Lobosporangium transversale TaxID=64571 RepID=A0A1Y2G5K9_9FUNG|nr:hypothetical protein BCR41DRAFT_365073 [Lobosporangium transversale]ORY95982.1 hypothetical protein BCR41DRAFT_365073 [Lobosporangium transversale]|eukprot:XP_021875423.1 hypothetical protein BCR41DRAFT_365073 [Lobosporangium transversale]
MNDLELHPLDIPEIISLVGAFLGRNDLLQCIRVSRVFHSTLFRFIWRRIVVKQFYLGSFPTKKALENNKNYIEELEFSYCFPEEYMALQGCGRLQSIECKTQPSFYKNPIDRLINSHSSTITRLSFQGPHLEGIWEALLGCTHLKTLTICEAALFEDQVDLFFQVCKKLNSLEMSSVVVYGLPSDFLGNGTNKFIFPSVIRLKLLNIQILDPPHPHTSSYCLGILARRCPGLRSLEFFYCKADEREMQQMHDDFYREIVIHHPQTLTNVSELGLGTVLLKDEDMAALLRQMTELRRLVVPRCDFGPLSIRELLADDQEILHGGGHRARIRRSQRLCDTIEELEYNRDSERTDGVVQAILSNCPRLKKLSGAKITVTEIVSGAKWVSTGLTNLSIQLVADVGQETVEDMQKQRIVFRQIGKLTRLRVLALTAGSSTSEQLHTLDLRLGAGLDELINLKNLHSLSFEGDEHQTMLPEDAKWILKNWPNIENLEGIVNSRHYVTASLFQSYNITTHDVLDFSNSDSDYSI